MWTTALKDLETGKIRLMLEPEEGSYVDLNRLERHVVPCTKAGDEPQFGEHDLTRECVCRPRIEKDSYDYDIVIHEDRKPN